MLSRMNYLPFAKIAAILTLPVCVTPLLAGSARVDTCGSYTVRSGDTFATIAREKGVGLPGLLSTNHISNPDRILIGQRIVIPGTKPSPAKIAATGTKGQAARKAAIHTVKRKDPMMVDITPPVQAGLYTVRSGDNLHRIQRRTGVTVSDLVRLNGLAESGMIRPGQSLRLTASIRTKTPSPENAGRTRQRKDQMPGISDRPHQPVPEPQIQANNRAALPERTGTAPHKVQTGETFSSISRRYSVTSAQLVQANRGIDPNHLRIGQALLIPGQPVRSPAKPLVVRADGRILAEHPDPLGFADDRGLAVTSARTRTGYLVEEGDTLPEIARRFNTSVDYLRGLNRLNSSDDIYPGRYILVPFIRQAPADSRDGRSDA